VGVKVDITLTGDIGHATTVCEKGLLTKLFGLGGRN
jgi:hypothetical protein